MVYSKNPLPNVLIFGAHVSIKLSSYFITENEKVVRTLSFDKNDTHVFPIVRVQTLKVFWSRIQKTILVQ